MKKTLFALLLCCSIGSFAQVKIGDNPGSMSPGSLLELESTSKALALPRMTTTQMQAIPSPLRGMIVFNIDSNCIYFYKNNNVWASITTDAAPQQWPFQSNDQDAIVNGNGQGIIALTGVNLIASGDFSHAEGAQSRATGDFSFAFGNTDTASALGSVAIGHNNKAAGDYSFALGTRNSTTYQSSLALGQENLDSGWASMAMGLKNRINNAVSYSNTLGYLNVVRGGSAHNLFGEANNINSGRANNGFGYSNILQGNFNTALGASNDILAGSSNTAAGENNTSKAGNASSLFGQNNIAEGSYLGAIGKDNIVYYQSAIALGQGNKDSGYASIAGGLNNSIYEGSQYGLALGSGNIIAGGSSDIAAGDLNLIKSGNANIVTGSANSSEGNFNTISGSANSSEDGNANVLLGQGNTGSGSNLSALGRDNSVFYQSAVALGRGNKDSGYATIAGGLNNVARAGVQYSAMFGNSNLVAGGSSHISLGEFNIVNSGRANSAFGYANTLAGNFGTTGGTGNDIVAGNSNSTFGENNTIRSGNANSLLGLTNIADGSHLGAIGKNNSVYYQSAVALGQDNRDSGWASVAAGLGNIIEKDIQYSIAVGRNNHVKKNLSLPFSNAGAATFSAGINNINSGFGSIALGGSNRPTNYYSVAANYNTISNAFGMSALGHYNDTLSAIQGSGSEATELLFSIGNGTDEQNRRNSFSMLRNGFTSINTTLETGVNTPRAELDVKGTGALIVPVGTTAERPATPVVGMIRFCTDCAGGPVLQGYDGSNWVNL